MWSKSGDLILAGSWLGTRCNVGYSKIGTVLDRLTFPDKTCLIGQEI